MASNYQRLQNEAANEFIRHTLHTLHTKTDLDPGLFAQNDILIDRTRSRVAPSNSFPSMHVSVATLTALHLYNNLKPFVGQCPALPFLFPVLIATSSLSPHPPPLS